MTRVFGWLVVRLSFVLAPAWAVAAVAAIHYLPDIAQGSGTPLGGLVPSHTQAVATQERELRAFGSTLLTPVMVVQHQRTPLSARKLQRTIATAAAVDRHRSTLRAISFAAPLVSQGRTTTVTYLYFRSEISPDHQLAAAATYAQRLDPPGLRTGPLLARNSEFDRIQEGLPRLTVAVIALIVVVLLAMFRAPGPPLLVLAAAAISYVVSTHLLAWVGAHQHRQLPKEVEPVLIALLLGLVTDYSIFFLTGMRRRLAEGERRFSAAEQTVIENVPIVFTAGLIVALGSLALVVGRLTVFRAFGPGMALGVAVTLAVAVTFVPAVLALLGRGLFWPSLEPRVREPRRRVWRFATARPVAAAIVVAIAASFVALAFGVSNLRLGFTIIRGQPPHAEVKVAAENAARGFAPGIVGPTEILLEAPGIGRRRDALASFQRSLADVTGVSSVLGPREQPHRNLPVFVSKSGNAARYAVVLRQEPLDAKAIEVLDRLKRQAPGMLRRAGLQNATLGFAGDTALAQETVHVVRGDEFRIGGLVLVVNFVLLAVFLRRLWPPVYLIAASALGLAATLGVTTWVMEDLLGHDDLTYYVPFAAIVLLLSLGSDYNVFVVGRIWQQAGDRPLREAIADVAPRTSSTVAIAGVTLAGSFALLALISLRPMRELALTMAVGILLDTFVIRSLLIPALLAVFRPDARRG